MDEDIILIKRLDNLEKNFVATSIPKITLDYF